MRFAPGCANQEERCVFAPAAASPTGSGCGVAMPAIRGEVVAAPRRRAGRELGRSQVPVRSRHRCRGMD